MIVAPDVVVVVVVVVDVTLRNFVVSGNVRLCHTNRRGWRTKMTKKVQERMGLLQLVITPTRRQCRKVVKVCLNTLDVCPIPIVWYDHTQCSSIIHCVNMNIMYILLVKLWNLYNFLIQRS